MAFFDDFSFDQGEANESSHDAPGEYGGYRNRDLPDEYTANGNKCNNGEDDWYQYDYAESSVGDSPKEKPCERLKSCCNDIGRLVKLMLSIFHNGACNAFWTVQSCAISLEKGPSIKTSEKFSEYTTQLLCTDPESPLALSFKEWNLEIDLGLLIVFSAQSPKLDLAVS